jgi:2-keto-4-pentenoate hydratase/2-oxohepta-3-ene-1,7-dioic acid hydratase in catechol pathway
MKIIRFRDENSRVLVAAQQQSGRVMLLEDPLGVIEPGHRALIRDRLRGRSAVVADDDENMCRMMATILRRFGCRCIVARDGAEAIKALEGNPVDLVVSDIQMPHCNGYEIFAAAQRIRPGIPVVLVTGFGYDPNHSLVRAEREGLSSVLYKPFTPDELLREVERAFSEAMQHAGDLLSPSGELCESGAPLSPLVPRTIIGIGRNYRTQSPGDTDVLVEATDPVPAPDDFEMFLKPPGALLDPGGTVRIPAFPGGIDPHLHAEAELAIVVGLRMQDVAPDDVRRHLLGATIAIDVTSLYFQDIPGSPRWFRGKGFDTFCPLGPAITTLDQFDFPAETEIRTLINGTLTRRGSIGQMLRPIDELISLLSSHCTLEPGTVVLTGGPPLISEQDGPPPPLRPGDHVVAEIDQLGTLEIRIA